MRRIRGGNNWKISATDESGARSWSAPALSEHAGLQAAARSAAREGVSKPTRQPEGWGWVGVEPTPGSRPKRAAYFTIVNGRIMSLSSCSRMWQW